MIAVKCTNCGKKVVWDDFQPLGIMCPKCRTIINVRDGYKENIKERERDPNAKIYHCPHCHNIVPRLWFHQCAKCQYYLFGPLNFNGKWPFVVGLAVFYAIFTACYWYFGR
jgi:phage FluMu protein Com